MSSSPLNNPDIAALGIALLVVLFVCGIFYLISFQSGWLALSRRFMRQSDPYGETRTVGPFFYTV